MSQLGGVRHATLRDPNMPIFSEFSELKAQCRYHVYTWIPKVSLTPPMGTSKGYLAGNILET